MKGITQLLWLVIALFIIVVTGSGLIGIANIFPASITIGGNTCTFAIPTYGRFACESMQSGETHTTTEIGAYTYTNSNFYVLFGDEENSPQGDMTITCDGGPGYFQYQADFFGCKIGSDLWCTVSFQPGVELKFVEGIQPGQKIRVGGCYDVSLIPGMRTGRVKEYYEPYALYLYEQGGKWTYNAESCNLQTGISWIDRAKIMTDCGGDLDCERVLYTDALQFGDWVNFLSAYVVIVPDENNKIVDYAGQTAYCSPYTSGAEILGITKIETESSCYFIPNNHLGFEDCCPGWQTANSICNDQFEWEELGGTEPPDLDCPLGLNSECPGAGQPFFDYSTPEYDTVRYVCQSGMCILAERIVHGCQPPNIGCLAGEVCQLNPTTQLYECKSQAGPGAFCGDGVCSPSIGENIESCPSDCTTTSWWDTILAYLSIFAVALIISAIAVIALSILIFKPLLSNMRLLLSIVILLALVLTVLFAMPLGLLAAQLL